MALIQCRECGKEISDQAVSCPGCGCPTGTHSASATTQVVTVASTKSRGVAILLALFLGGVGGHKFYLGRVGPGMFYLLFCWTLIPALLAVFDIIGLALTSEQAFQQKYGNPGSLAAGPASPAPVTDPRYKPMKPYQGPSPLVFLVTAFLLYAGFSALMKGPGESTLHYMFKPLLGSDNQGN